MVGGTLVVWAQEQTEAINKDVARRIRKGIRSCQLEKGAVFPFYQCGASVPFSPQVSARAWGLARDEPAAPAERASDEPAAPDAAEPPAGLPDVLGAQGARAQPVALPDVPRAQDEGLVLAVEPGAELPAQGVPVWAALPVEIAALDELPIVAV